MAERIVPVFKTNTVSLNEWIPSGDWDQPQGSLEKDGGILLEAHRESGSDKVTYKVCKSYPQCETCINEATCPIASMESMKKALL